MPTAVIDGITTRYEITGSGPPLLMLAPGGFDATVEKWTTLSVYARVRPLEWLARRYTCIAFDRRECGQSGGRVERVTWTHYATQAKGLLDHLNIARAHVMGGCMGCSVATALAVAHPDSIIGMVLWWPVGGAKYRIRGRKRFTEHLNYVAQHGLQAVVARVEAEGKAFNADPRAGPWASVIRNDHAFARTYAAQDVARYNAMVAGMASALFERDTSPGAEPEDLMRLETPALIVPGHDESHATSAARYLEECLPRATYWDVPVDAQTAHSASSQLLDFLDRATTP